MILTFAWKSKPLSKFMDATEIEPQQLHLMDQFVDLVTSHERNN